MGTRIKVRVTPRGSKNEVLGMKEGVLHIKTTAPPVDGAANEAVIKLLCHVYKTRKSGITLISGEKSRDKVFDIEI